MTENVMDFHAADGDFCPALFPVERTSDALADYCKRRWPKGVRRRAVRDEWGLTEDESRAICEGAASKATLDRVWRHRRGGWAVILPIFAHLLGEGVDQFIARERQANAQTAIRLREVSRSLRAATGGGDLGHSGVAAQQAGGCDGRRSGVADGRGETPSVAGRSGRGGRT
jgi:hypothetical protein